MWRRTHLSLHQQRHDDLVSVVLRREDQRRRLVPELRVVAELVAEERLVTVFSV